MTDSPWADSPDAPAVVDEVIDRCRRGERPNPAEYAARFPHAAAEVREAVRLLVAMERAAAGPAPDAPAQVGEYRIVRRVGAGGMGVVFEAVQEPLGRRVAVKLLPSTASATDRERFRREARAAAGLHHTNIVPVYDVGEAGGVPYFAMQYIPGRTLKDAIAEVRAARTGADVSASVARLASRTGPRRPAGGAAGADSRPDPRTASCSLTPR